MINLKKTCLIITGTISPNSKVFTLSLTDSNERLKQYILSIKYYIVNTNIKNIVFCENSNSYSKEIENLKNLAHKKCKNFEYLYFKGDEGKVLSKGKGYGEGEIIEYVLKNSILIKDCNKIIKATGRVKVRNINFFLKFCKNRKNYFDTISVPEERCDTRFYIIDINDYEKYFINAYKKVNDRKGHWLEHEFKDILNNEEICYKNFIFLPNVDGISGSTGNKYEYSKKLAIKYVIKLILIKINLFHFLKGWLKKS